MKKNKDIGPQFITVSGVLILVGVVFISIKNYMSGTNLFSVWFLGLFFAFGLLVFIKGVRDIKQQKNALPEIQSKRLNAMIGVTGMGLLIFFMFALYTLVFLFLFMHYGFGFNLF